MKITEEMIAVASEAYNNTRRARYADGFYGWHYPAMKAALEAVADSLDAPADADESKVNAE